MHHSGHLGVTGKSKIDHKLQAFTFDWGIGLYAPWWRVRHNRHHASPNDAEIDPDLETPPLLLWHKDLLEHRKYKMWAGKPIVKKLLAIQRQMLFIYLAFYTYFLHFGSRRLASKDVKNPRKRMDTMGTWANIVFLVAIFALTSQPWWRWVAAWMGGQAITGIYIGWIFALNHFAMPLAKKSHHFVETVLRTTLNVSYAVGSPFNPLSRTIDFATGYLGYQVEHHLFPRMPACHYPHVHERVRQWVAETLTDVPFIEMDWMAAHKTMMNALVPL
jgi:fatty acid desaturase